MCSCKAKSETTGRCGPPKSRPLERIKLYKFYVTATGGKEGTLIPQNLQTTSTLSKMVREHGSGSVMFLPILKTVIQQLHTTSVLLLLLLGSMCMSPKYSGSNSASAASTTDECQVTPVIHVLQYPGCVPKPIPSFACTGRCASYIQVSGSKIWQMERSCMCCQESGEREASVSLFCPKAKPGERKFKKVTTKAPLECMCRPCTGVEESAVIPQEIAGYADEGPLSNHFLKSQTQQ